MFLSLGRGRNLTIKFYRKPVHTGCNHNFESYYRPYVKRGIVQSMDSKASVICQNSRTFSVKLTTWDVIFSSVVIPSGSWTWFLSPVELADQKIGKSLSVLCLFSVWRAFLKVELCNIRSVFKTKHTLKHLLMRARPEINLQEIAHYICVSFLVTVVEARRQADH
jgi:hypothetical protein